MKLKENLLSLKEKIKQHKKACIISAIVVVLLIFILLLLALTTCTSQPQLSTETDQDPIGDTTFAQGFSNGDENNPPETEESADNQSEIAADEQENSPTSANNTQSNSGSSNSSEGNSGSGGNSSGGTDDSVAKNETNTSEEVSKTWVVDYEMVWVEDKAAWDESVPIYGREEISVCNICGQNITGNEAAHGKIHMLAGEGSGHHTETIQVITGYDSIHHDATCHWEKVEAGGHWE